MALKILAPASSLEDIRRLIQAGADEFYAGLLTEEVVSRYTNVFSLNLRQVAGANFRSFRDMEDAIGLAHAHGKDFFAAFNAHYMDDQVSVVLEQAERLITSGVDALIVGDIGLFYTLRKRFPDCSLHVSTTAGVFNAESARFFEERGASRVILPRGLTLAEIDRLQAGLARVRFEVFILSERCLFTNAHCHWEHSQYEAKQGPVHRAWQGVRKRVPLDELPAGMTFARKVTQKVQERMIRKYGPPCFAQYEAELHDEQQGTVRAEKPFFLQNFFDAVRDACGACAVYDLHAMKNVESLKIVGRNHPVSKKVKDTTMLREILNLLESGPPREEFLREARRIREHHYPGMCEERFCYYPSP
jgi:collagenase-like PrtC family protease